MQRYVWVATIACAALVASGCEQKHKEQSIKDPKSATAASPKQETQEASPRLATSEAAASPEHDPLAHGHEDEGLLRRMGVEKRGSTIMINLNRSEAYMRELTDKMRTQALSVQTKLETFAQEVNRSVRIQDDTVTIDLSKVKRSMQDLEAKSRSWIEKMQTMVQEVQKEINASR